MNYFSFLICEHENQTDLYINGLPIGIVRDGAFEVHQFVLPNSEKVPLNFRDVKVPFKTAAEFKAYLQRLVALIEI